MVSEEKLKRNLKKNFGTMHLTRYFAVCRCDLFKVLCMCAIVLSIVCLGADYGKVTAFAEENVQTGSEMETILAEDGTETEDETEDGTEEKDVSVDEDSAALPDGSRMGTVDLEEIYKIGGYAQAEQVLDEEEDGIASLASSSKTAREDKIANGIKAFKTNINLRGMGVTRNNIAAIMANMQALHPEIVYIANTSYSYNAYTGEVNYLLVSYIPNAKNVKNQLTAAVKKVNKAVNIKNMKPEEIVLAYHEYLTSTVEYDDSGYSGYSTVYGRAHKYDMYGTLVNKKAVCQGYAETMNYFLRKAGIPCGLASSVYVFHAWNVVRINGKWYHVDATWDDPSEDIPGQSRHDYFLISKETLDNKTKNASSKYPLGRYDTKVSGLWNGKYTGATDKKYERGQMWSGVNRVMYYRKGYWYSIKQGKSATEWQIIKNRFSTGGKKVILSGSDLWTNTSGGYYPGQYGFIFLSQEMLYFSTTRYVGWIDLDSPKYKYKLVYDIRGSYSDGINIYGMGWHNNQIVVWVSYDPLCSAKDAYLLDPCLKHSWNKGKVTKKPTYSATGVKQYTCKKCSYKKNVKVPRLKLGKTYVKTTPTSRGIKLTWRKVSGASGYRVYKKTKSGSFRYVKSVRSLSYLDRSVSSGSTYTYGIVAVNKYTKGKAAKASRLFLGNVKTKVENTTRGVKVSWNRVRGANKYKIYKKTKTGSYRLAKTVSSRVTTWTDSKVNACKQYSYVVMPYRKSTGGSYRAATTLYLRTPSVGVKKATKGVTVSWKKSVGADSYYIFRKTPTSNWKQLKVLRKPKTLRWNDRNALKGHTYYYSVIAARGKYSSAAAPAKAIKR